MQFQENLVIVQGDELLLANKITPPEISPITFLDWAEAVKDCIMTLPRAKRNSSKMMIYAKKLRILRDQFEYRVSRDPMIMYRPRHGIALEFHQSQALYRYAHGGNRSSKTVAAQWETWATVTGNHIWRKPPPFPSSVMIIGHNYSRYCPTVFEPKYVIGEAGNPLSPIFPENGKWFNRYDSQHHILTLCCPECAEKGLAKRCSHEKSRIMLFSDESGALAAAGGQFSAFHFDEQISEPLFEEACQRISTVPNAFGMVTETPLKGRQFWTWKRLASMADAGMTIPGTDTPICTRHNIDQFQAGLRRHDQLLADIQHMSDPEVMARVLGMPMVDLEKAVFDLEVLIEMESEIKKGDKYIIDFCNEVGLNGQKWVSKDNSLSFEESLRQGIIDAETKFIKSRKADLTIFEKPKAMTQYLITADVAEGLVGGDYSSASVWKLLRVGNEIHVEQVAHFNGHINPEDYAIQLYLLGVAYGYKFYYPQLVVERNGPGMATIRKLIDLHCPFLYQDQSSIASVVDNMASLYGVHTNRATKPAIIASLQRAIKMRRYGKKNLIIRSRQTINELQNYIQDESDSGRTKRLQAEGGGNDDCVMDAALAAYSINAHGIYDYGVDELWKRESLPNDDKLDDNSDKLWSHIHKRDSLLKEMYDELEEH